MGIIHRFVGSDEAFDWEHVPEKVMNSPGALGVSGKILIGPADEAPHFRVRYFRIEPGGHSQLEQHPHDHGVFILHGRAGVTLGTQAIEAGPRDVIYVPGNERHQFRALGDEALGFLCVIPAR